MVGERYPWWIAKLTEAHFSIRRWERLHLYIALSWGRPEHVRARLGTLESGPEC
jgi:hypothetical protein